jgi:HK97 family phage prohead protease
MERELRHRAGVIELRATDDGSKRIGGYAIVFDELSENLGGFREVISPSAVDSVDFSRTVALFNHDSSKVLGSTASGTLELERDEMGLRFSLDVPATTYAADLYEMVQRRDINGASFGFFIADGGDDWAMGDDDIPVRTVTQISDVPEVSVGVVFPAYPQSSTVVHRARQFASVNTGKIDSARRARKLRLMDLGA